eukprot:scpid59868/ scgid25056/ Rho GTPase-activating protein 24; Down-regulated in nephrectomized rat kidney \
MDALAESLPFGPSAANRVRKIRDRARSDDFTGCSRNGDGPYPGTLGVFKHLVASGSVPVFKQLGVLHQGYLTKRGGNFASWRRRWFVLRGDIIFYFREPDDMKHLGEIPLAGNIVRRCERADVKGAPSNFLFEIAPGEGSEGFAKDRGNYLLSASNQLDMEEWITKITHVIAKEEKCMFKQVISETVQREVNRRHGGIIPLIVLQCCCFLSQYGLDEIGLFRQSGRANRIKQFQEMYDRGQYPEFGTSLETDVHTVASLLKLYLRSIPEAIIPQEYNDSFIAATRFYRELNSAEGVQVMIGQLKGLPKASYDCLKFVCRFLHTVQEHADKNKMDSSNLAVVFGPNLVRPGKNQDENSIQGVADMIKVVKDTGDMNVLTRILIDEHDKLFPVVPDECPIFQLMDYTTLMVDFDSPCASELADKRTSIKSVTSATSAIAALNPVNEGENKELLYFSSSDDDTPVEQPARSASTAHRPGSTGVSRTDSASQSWQQQQAMAPAHSSAGGSSTTQNGTDGDPSVTVRQVPGRQHDNRLAAFTSRLEEMQTDVEENRRLAADAQHQLKRETLAKNAWECRYKDEKKAREAAEDRIRALEAQLDRHFSQKFPC